MTLSNTSAPLLSPLTFPLLPDDIKVCVFKARLDAAHIDRQKNTVWYTHSPKIHLNDRELFQASESVEPYFQPVSHVWMSYLLVCKDWYRLLTGCDMSKGVLAAMDQAKKMTSSSFLECMKGYLNAELNKIDDALQKLESTHPKGINKVTEACTKKHRQITVYTYINLMRLYSKLQAWGQDMQKYNYSPTQATVLVKVWMTLDSKTSLPSEDFMNELNILIMKGQSIRLASQTPGEESSVETFDRDDLFNFFMQRHFSVIEKYQYINPILIGLLAMITLNTETTDTQDRTLPPTKSKLLQYLDAEPKYILCSMYYIRLILDYGPKDIALPIIINWMETHLSEALTYSKSEAACALTRLHNQPVYKQERYVEIINLFIGIIKERVNPKTEEGIKHLTRLEKIESNL